MNSRFWFFIFSTLCILRVSAMAQQRQWTPVGPGAGSDLLTAAFQPDNPDVIYVAGDIEGIFKTTDGGRTWRMINNTLSKTFAANAYYVQDIAINPLNYRSVFIAAGAVFKSTAASDNWQLFFPDTIEYTERFDEIAAAVIEIDPVDTNFILVGSGNRHELGEGTGRLYRTSDGGQTWDTLSLPGNPSNVTGIVIDPISPVGNRRIFVATDSGMYRSDDGGQTWDAVSNGLTDKICRQLRGVVHNGQLLLFVTVELDVDPQDTTRYTGGIFRSTDLGETWVDITGNLPKWSVEDEAAYTYASFAVHPSNPEIIYIATFRNYAAWSGAGIFKTTDGGQTWRRMQQGYRTSTGWLETPFFEEYNAHYLEMAPSDPSILIMGTVDVYRTTDAGATWEQIYATKTANGWATRGMECMAVEGIAFDPSDPDVLYVAYDDFGPFRSDDGGHSFYPLDPYQDPYEGYDAARNIIVDPANSNIIYLTRYEGIGATEAIGYADGGLWISRDRGNTWQRVANLPKGKPFLVMDTASGTPQTRTLYYASFWNGLYKSTDSGNNWTQLGADTNFRYIWTLSINPANASEIFVGLYKGSRGGPGGLYTSTDGGATWRRLEHFPASSVFNIKFDSEGTVYVCATDFYDWSTEGGLYRSTDGGATWTKIFDAPRTFDVAIDPANPRNIAVAVQAWYQYLPSMKKGIHVTTDGGQTWTDITNNLQHTLITFITLNPTRPNQLYVGTLGGGLWRTDEVFVTAVRETRRNRQSQRLRSTVHPNPLRETANIEFVLPQPAHVRLTVTDMLGRTVATIVEGAMTAGKHSVVFDATALPTGVYAYHLSVGGAVDVKRIVVVK